MKKIYIFLFVMAALRLPLIAQDTIAAWTFPTGTAADSIANFGNASNSASAIRTDGGTSAIDFSKNGFTGKAAQATGWDNGANTKAWVISFSSIAYQNLTISCRQQSGGANAGPANYQIQYWVNASQGWQDVPGGSITTANDWTTSYVNALALPADLINQVQKVMIRWLQTTNTSSSGGTVAATGNNKIDEIYITGTPYNVGIPQVTVAKPRAWVREGQIQLENMNDVSRVSVCDISGRIVYDHAEAGIISSSVKGCYLVVVEYGNKEVWRGKVVL